LCVDIFDVNILYILHVILLGLKCLFIRRGYVQTN
jgi:hypothetical protein